MKFELFDSTGHYKQTFEATPGKDGAVLVPEFVNAVTGDIIRLPSGEELIPYTCSEIEEFLGLKRKA